MTFPRKHAPRPDQAQGQTLVEYCCILALLSVVVGSVLYTLGGQVKTTFVSVSSSVSSAVTSSASGGAGLPPMHGG